MPKEIMAVRGQKIRKSALIRRVHARSEQQFRTRSLKCKDAPVKGGVNVFSYATVRAAP